MQIPCKVQMDELIIQDIKQLPPDVRKECFEMLTKLQSNIHMSKPLKNKNGNNLSDCYKILFYNAKYRIVYRKCGIDSYELLGVKPSAEIIAIGRRDGQEVYNIAAERLGRKN